MATLNGTSGKDMLVGTAGNDVFIGSGDSDLITGGGGSDSINYGGFSAGPISAAFDASGYAGTVTKPGGTDSFSGIRGVWGTNFDDTLVGSSNPGGGMPYPVLLRGGAGNDSIDGSRSTLNRVDYSDATMGVLVRLQTSVDADGNWYGTASDGHQVAGQPAGTAYTDTLRNVARVMGGASDDTLIGGDAYDRIDASLGNDLIDGQGGFNTVDYGTLSGSVTVTGGNPLAGLFGLGTASVAKSAGGADTLTNVNEIRGTGGNDVLYGTTAAYSWQGLRLRGAGGNDTIYGYGNTTNAADYSDATAAVAIDLQSSTDAAGNWIGSAIGNGSVGTDMLVSVARLRTSNYNDTIYGSQADDMFDVFQLGSHLLYGRGGANEVRVSIGAAAVTIDLGTTASGTGYGGYLGSITKPGGAVDTLYDFSRAQGGAGDDTIFGTPGNDTLAGGAGDNLIDGRGGSNTQTYRSIAGQVFQTHGAVIDLGDGTTGTATNPWGGTDTLHNIQNAIGSQFADSILGAAIAGTQTFLRGEGGNDTLAAPSADTLVTASYTSSLSGVVVDLKQGKAFDDGWFGGQDTLVNIQAVRGSAFADSITGSDRNDLLEGGAGDDTLDGGAGRDTAVFQLASGSATLAKQADGSWTVTSALGTDTLRNIEYLQFTDRTLALPGTAVRHDLDGNGTADILWHNADGSVAAWAMTGFAGTGAAIAKVGADWTLLGSADFNGDGHADLLWRGADGSVAQWQMDGDRYLGGGSFATADLGWKVAGLADMDGDGKADILWRNDDGNVAVWRMDGTTYLDGGGLGNAGAAWKVAGLADFDGDGKADILWRNDDGNIAIWRMDGTTFLGGGGIGNPGAAWKVAGTGDLDGDGKADIVWRNDDGTVAVWTMDGLQATGGATIATPGTGWSIAAVGDYNGDGRADLLWRATDGSVSLWLMDGTTATATASLGNPGHAWSVIG